MRKADERMGTGLGAFFACIMLLIPVMTMITGLGGSSLIDNDGMDPETIYDLEAVGNGPFIKNHGQWNEDVRFIAGTSFGSIGIGDGCIYYHIDSKVTAPTMDEELGYVVKVTFIGAEGGAPIGSMPLATRYNYFIGNDPTSWATDVECYSSVVYEEIWAGVDLVYHNENGKLKYDLVLDAGADIADVRMKVEGISDLVVRDGSLYMVLDDRTVLTDSSLKVYYMDDGGIIDADLWVDGNTYGFLLGDHDSSRAIVIDPEINLNALNFSTYVGGSGDDEPYGMDIGLNGDVFVCGYTQCEDLPTTPGAYRTTKVIGWHTGFVLRLSADGKDLVYCTYIGGSEGDYATDIHLTPKGSVIVTGFTHSSDFPVTDDAYDSSLSGYYDNFVLELGPTGSTLIGSTLIGGEQNEGYPEMDLDEDGNVYVVTTTNSTRFPVTDDAIQDSLSEGQSEEKVDLCIFVMDLANMELVYSTYLGGTDWEFPSDIVCGSTGMVYVAGQTCSKDLDVTQGAYATTLSGDWDGFILKVSTKDGRLMMGTYFGGSDYDAIYGIDIHGEGDLYACGQTYSSDLPVSEGAYDQNLDGGTDGFVMILNRTDSSLTCSTYIGGNDEDWLRSLKIDPFGSVHTVGSTASTDIPVQYMALQMEYAGSTDIVYFKMTKDAGSISYSTYLGGSGHEFQSDSELAIDPSDGTPVIAGSTSSADFPTTAGSYDTSYDIISSDKDLFVTKLYPELPPGLPVVRKVIAGDSFVNLTWEIPVQNQTVPVLDFEILRGTVQGLLEVIGLSGAEVFYNDSTVTNGIIYRYAVRGTNEMGAGLTSLEVTARPGTRPTAPRNLTADHADATVVLSWDAPEKDGGWEVSHYLISRTNLSSGGIVTEIDDVKEHTYTDHGLVNGLGYSYTVSAVNELGTSERSIPVTVVPMRVPDPPRDLTISCGPGHSLLEWKHPEYDGGSPLTSYRVHRVSEDESITVFELPVEVSTLNDTGVSNGKGYLYWVTACNMDGESEPSNEVPSYPMDVPGCPQDLKAEVSDGVVSLRWGPPLTDGGSPVRGYSVSRNDGNGWNEVQQVLPEVLTFTDRSIDNGMTYRYRVNTWNLVGTSPYSNEVAAAPLGCPSVPIGLTGTSGDGYVLISWERPDDGGAGISSYSIQRKDQMAEYGPYMEVSGSVLGFNDTHVVNGNRYQYRVRAVNSVGVSGFSDEASFIPAGLSDPPTGLTLSRLSVGILMEWKAPEDTGGLKLSGTRIYRGTTMTGLTLLTEVGRGGVSYRDLAIENRTTYYYAVSSLNSLGEGRPSEVQSIILSTVPGVPLNLSVVAGNGCAIISFMPPTDDGGSHIVRFEVFRMMKNDQWNQVALLGVGTFYWTDGNVTEGQTYIYKVRALNERGVGPFSSTVEVSIGTDAQENEDDGDDKIGLILPIVIPVIMMLAILAGAGFLVLRVRSKRALSRIEDKSN
ncbi:MAG: fibronectin type III domain-containing protein [Candidatus Thermoplasmatota archaeon]|jgi:fibronectin type 3 domain-containing protein|nr:fibronectin type III domain-containing protein [Candidatus Thermoplasmatota archaeon]